MLKELLLEHALLVLMASVAKLSLVNFKNRLTRKLSKPETDFHYFDIHYSICVASFTFCAAIWMIHKDLKKVFKTLHQKTDAWVKIIENIEILVFTLMIIVTTIETIIQKKNQHLNMIRSIEQQLNTPCENPKQVFVCLIFYTCLTLTILFQVLFEYNELNYKRFLLIAVGQFYLLNCELRFVSVIFSVTRNFQLLNRKLNKKLCKSSEPSQFWFYVNIRDSLQHLQDFSNLHWSICQYVNIANRAYGLRLFAIIVCIFYKSMFIPYLLSLNLIKAYTESSRKELTYSCSLVFHLAQLLLLTLSADSATKEAERTRIIFSEYLSSDLKEQEFEHVEVILSYFEVHQAEFKIMNLFILNRNFVLKIFGAVTTYTIIFIQLQDVINLAEVLKAL